MDSVPGYMLWTVATGVSPHFVAGDLDDTVIGRALTRHWRNHA